MTDIEKKEENKIFGCEIPNELIIAGVGIGVAIIAYGIYYFYNQYGIPGEGDTSGDGSTEVSQSNVPPSNIVPPTVPQSDAAPTADASTNGK